MRRIKLAPTILAVILALITTFFLKGPAVEYAPAILPAVELVGGGFLRLLRFLVIPLVCSSIICSVGKLRSETNIGMLGVKTLFFYLSSTLVALLIGIALVNCIQPGMGYDPNYLPSVENSEIVLQKIDARYFLDQFLPSNLFQALAEGKMVALIFFSAAFGMAMVQIRSSYYEILLSFFEAIFETMLQLSSLVLRILPLGIYCLMVHSFVTLGSASLRPLALFSLTVLLGLFLFLFVFFPCLLKFYARISPLRYFRAVSPALVTAFTTSSSAASIPVTVACMEKLGISQKIARLIVPLGISITLSGSALYECVAALFVAQAYGIEMSIGMQFAAMFLALITSMGVAGIPAGSLVATMVVMQCLGLPPEGIGLFIAVERFMDMARTAANIYGDGACAVFVAVSEGELQGEISEENSPEFS